MNCYRVLGRLNYLELKYLNIYEISLETLGFLINVLRLFYKKIIFILYNYQEMNLNFI